MENKKTKKPFAKKSFGQNFLTDQNYIDKIITALCPQEGEKIIEIGAGRGALTESLITSGAAVTAIELEREMIEVLKDKFGAAENFRLIESDALKVDFAEIFQNEKTKLVANLPYYISTAILQKLIEQRDAFSEMILMFQFEVVERITAQTGSKERGFLTVLTEAFLTAEKLFDVPPNAFRPAPKVCSAVVRLTPKTDVTIDDEAFFRELISAAFRQKRKTIYNNLKEIKGAAVDWTKILKESSIEPNRRAESLEQKEWERLYQTSRRFF